MRIIQLQTKVSRDKWENLYSLRTQMKAAITKAVSSDGIRPDLITVGEMFACPYETACFPAYAEEEGGPAWRFLSELAAECDVCLSAGSVPEIDDGHIYNTAYVFDRDGRQLARHRKMHLFDIDVKGGQHFRESDTLTAGREVTVFDTDFGRVGLCICFDCRFPELIRLMVLEGARLILVPAAFNTTTGPAHWEVMFRSRAVDNQCFMVGTSVARDETASYHAWGHSLTVSPWGTILSEMDASEAAAVIDIDLSETDRIRGELPLLSARREDVYQLRMSHEK